MPGYQKKIRAKIWKDEYVDFGSLLANPVLVDQYQIAIYNSDSSFTPSLCLEPLARHKKVTTIETWLREAARVFRESKISNEKPNLFLFYQNIPLCELVSKKIF